MSQDTLTIRTLQLENAQLKKQIEDLLALPSTGASENNESDYSKAVRLSFVRSFV